MIRLSFLKSYPSLARRLTLFGYLGLLALSAMTILLGASILSLSTGGDLQADQLLERLERPADILLFGDSVIYSHGLCDDGTRTIPEFMASYTDHQIHSLYHAGFTPIVFREYIRLLPQATHQPSVILVGVNLRSYSDSWSKSTTFAFYRRRAVLSWMQGNRNWTPIKYDLNARYGFALIDAGRTIRGFGFSKDKNPFPGYLRRDLECIRNPDNSSINDHLGRLLDHHYGQAFTRNHPLLRALEEMIDDAFGMGITPVVYLTPINMDDIARHAPPTTATAVQHSVETVTAALAERGVTVLDLHDALPAERFIDQGWACEHLDQTGRQWLAKILTATCAPLLPDPLPQSD